MPIARVWIKLTSSGSLTLPNDWNPYDNTIEGIGAGSRPGWGTTGASGGTGGCYAGIHNLNLPAGTVCAFQVGVPSGPLDTWFRNTATLVAKGAQTTTSGCVGQVVFAGGAAGPGYGAAGGGGGGGGGAGGPNGAGQAGSAGVGGQGGNGGRGDAGAGGAGGITFYSLGGSGGAGAPGAEWNIDQAGLGGSGGGGGGGNNSGAGGNAGAFGAGAGGAGANNVSGLASPGVIYVSYTPLISGHAAAVENPDGAVFVGVDFWAATIAAQEAPDTAVAAGGISWRAAMAAQEAPDLAVALATVLVHGAAAATEGPDGASFAVSVRWLAAIAAQEASDAAIVHALAFWPNTLAAFEDQDTALMRGLLAAFGPMAAHEEPDTAAITVQSGSLWPPLLGVGIIVEQGDVANFQCLSTPLGHLEFYGVGSSTLYHGASPLERAMADVEVAHMMALPARLITENLDPWKVQSGDNLIFLAYGMGATLWEDSWSELTKRQWVASQWTFKSLVGFLPAYKMALGASGYDITNVVTPPGGFFVSPDLTVAQTNDWLRKMPEIRITFESKSKDQGIDEIFACPDDAAAADFSNYFDQDYAGDNDGRALYGRFAYLRKDGVDSPLAITDGLGGLTETISVPQIDPNSFFSGDGVLDDDNSYAFVDAGASNVFSFVTDDWANLTADDLSLTALAAGLDPLSPRFELNSDTEIDTAPSAFAGDWSPDVEYLTVDKGRSLLANVLYLLDPAVAAPMTAQASFVDDARIDIPSDYAELTIDCHVAMPDADLVADDGFTDSICFYVDEDLSAFDRTRRAIISAKALRDTILIGFAGSPLVVPPPPPSWEPLHGAMAATEGEDVALFIGYSVRAIFGSMAAIESPDFCGPIDFSTMAAIEAADVFAGRGALITASGAMAADEGADAFAGSGAISAGVPVSGAFAAVEGADLAAAAGAVVWRLTMAAVETADAFAGAGAIISAFGAMAAQEAPDTFFASSSSYNAAVMAATEGSDGANATGSVFWAAPMAAAEGPDTAIFGGNVAWLAAMAATEAADLAAFFGSGIIVGAMAATEGSDGFAGAGSVAWAAYLAAAEGPDAFASSGATVSWAASMAAIEAADIAVFLGSNVVAGAMVAQEAPDAISANASVAWAATLVASEAPDTAAFVGAGIIIGALAATEGADLAAVAGNVAWRATLAATEAPDGASASGQIITSGSMAAIEAPDSFAATNVAPIFGAMAAREDPDIGGGPIVYYSDGLFFVQSADFAVGSIYWPAIMAITEAPDIMSAALSIVSPATMAATEAPDVFIGIAGGGVSGAMAALEGPDIASFQSGGILLSEAGEPVIAEQAVISYYTDGIFFFNDETRILIE